MVAYCVDANDEITAYLDGRSARKAVPQNVFGAIALACIAIACGWTLYANLFETPPVDAVAAPTVTVVAARPTAPAVTVVVKQPAPTQPTLLTAPTFDIALLEQTYVSGAAPVTFSQSAPMKSALQPARPTVAQSLPAPSPAVAQVRNPALRATAQRGGFRLASAESTPFDKILGKPETAGPALAYAAHDGGVFNDGQSLTPGGTATNDGLTAVYDISARTVYLPDGTKLEAHSGLRDKLDDPRYVNLRMRGATPPHTYDLVPRESLFHGVQALRMIPVGGESEVFGRTGLLAHSYMLGPNGDSNGCVSFKDYNAFLRAYQNGKVKRLVVVAHGGRTAWHRGSNSALSPYRPARNSSLASRTSSSARSLN